MHHFHITETKFHFVKNQLLASRQFFSSEKYVFTLRMKSASHDLVEY